MATTDLIGAPERTDLPRPTAPLPPAAVSALARLERAFAPTPVDPAVRLSAVSAECRRLSAAAMTSADFDELLCVQDELAMCSCLVAAADEHGKTEPPLPVRPPRPHPHAAVVR